MVIEEKFKEVLSKYTITVPKNSYELEKLFNYKNDIDKPLVSIICNTFNHARYVRKTLESFINQRVNFSVEILLHDDASTDGTQEIVKEYTEKYPNLFKTIIQKENQYSKKVKITPTFQYPRISGKYVAFCEGDDMWIDEYKLYKQLSFLEKNSEFSASLHNSIVYDMSSTKRPFYLFCNSKFSEYGIKEAFKNKCHLSSIVCKKEVLLSELPSYFSVFHGDKRTKIQLALSGKIHFINEPMSLYRWFSCSDAWSFKTQFTYSKDLTKYIDFFDKFIVDYPQYKEVAEHEKIRIMLDRYVDYGDKEMLKNQEVLEAFKKLPKKLQRSANLKCKFKRLFILKLKIRNKHFKRKVARLRKKQNYL